MKLWPALLTMLLLNVGATACGSSKSTSSAPDSHAAAGSTTATAATASAPTDYAKADKDKDNDFSGYDDTEHSELIDYGHAANAVDKQAITKLIKRYYVAAATKDGAKACSMIYGTMARSVPEDYGTSPPGQPYMQGKTCPAVLTLLFKHFQSQITADRPLLKITHIRLAQHHGFVLLSFGTMPERQISVGLEGHTWKMQGLLDNELP